MFSLVSILLCAVRDFILLRILDGWLGEKKKKKQAKKTKRVAVAAACCDADLYAEGGQICKYALLTTMSGRFSGIVIQLNLSPVCSSCSRWCRQRSCQFIPFFLTACFLPLSVCLPACLPAYLPPPPCLCLSCLRPPGSSSYSRWLPHESVSSRHQTIRHSLVWFIFSASLTLV